MNQLLWGVYEKEPFFMTISNVYQLKIIRELQLTGFFLNHQIGRLGFCVLLTKTSTTDTREHHYLLTSYQVIIIFPT